MRLRRLLGSLTFDSLARGGCPGSRLGAGRSTLVLHALNLPFHELQLNAQIIDFVGLGRHVRDLRGQHLDVARIVAVGVDGWGRCCLSCAHLRAHLLHDDNDRVHLVLQATDRVAKTENVLTVALDHAIVERDLLLQTGEDVQFGLCGRRAICMSVVAWDLLRGAH